MKGGPFGDIKKIAKKSLTKPKKIYTKKLVKGGTRTHVLPLGRPQKAVTSCQCGLVLVPDNVSARQQC